jgi:AcrR family transcriptional regulator
MLEIQRARILGAMSEVCMELGSGSVTVAQVVERAGVSRRTFYELFQDSGDCFLAAFEAGVDRASRHLLEDYDPGARWVERIRSALTGLLSLLDTERNLAHLLIVGSTGAGAETLEYRRRLLARIVEFVDEGRMQTKAAAELPPLTAEGIVGGVLSVLHSRLPEPHNGPLLDGRPDGGGPLCDGIEPDTDSPAPERGLLELTGPLMSMIVLPYLGPAAARKELARPIPKPTSTHRPDGNPLGELEMRLTYRTVRVLTAIAANPGSSNRFIADAAEIVDQGQMSKLLARLHDIGLIQNTGGGATKGEPNAWTLTDKGWQIQGAIAE